MMKQLGVPTVIAFLLFMSIYAEGQSIIHTSNMIRVNTHPTASQCRADLDAWNWEIDKWGTHFEKGQSAPMPEERMTTEALYHRLYEATACVVRYKTPTDVKSHIIEIKGFEDQVVRAQGELLFRAASVMDDHKLSAVFLQYERSPE
jgi:hypothetical protein